MSHVTDMGVRSESQVNHTSKATSEVLLMDLETAVLG